MYRYELTEIAPAQLTGQQGVILRYLRSHPGQTTHEIAHSIGDEALETRQGASKVVQWYLNHDWPRKGWVRREPAEPGAAKQPASPETEISTGITVTIHRAKSTLSKLIEMSAAGTEVIIARGTKPVARLVPIGEVRGKRRPGAWKGRIHVGPEFFEPLPEEELAAWEK